MRSCRNVYRAANRSSRSHLSLPSCVNRLTHARLCPIGTRDQSVSASIRGILLGVSDVLNSGMGLSFSCLLAPIIVRLTHSLIARSARPTTPLPRPRTTATMTHSQLAPIPPIPNSSSFRCRLLDDGVCKKATDDGYSSSELVRNV